MGNRVGRRGLTVRSRTELPGKCKSEDGTSLSGRVEATTGIIRYAVTLAMDENTRMGREALHLVKTRWGQQF